MIPMPGFLFLSVAWHHSEPADPVLLEWIKDFFDHYIGFGPWTVVILAGLVVLAIPLSVTVFYWLQQRRSTPEGRLPGKE